MTMELFDHDHEQVVVRADARTGLRAIIAIHDTRLGPAAGGCRRWIYPDTDSALRDALRLSQGMTYKNAVAGLPFGGGKSVILGAPHEPISRAQLEVFGRWVEELGGRYIEAPGPSPLARIAGDDTRSAIGDRQIAAESKICRRATDLHPRPPAASPTRTERQDSATARGSDSQTDGERATRSLFQCQ